MLIRIVLSVASIPLAVGLSYATESGHDALISHFPEHRQEDELRAIVETVATVPNPKSDPRTERIRADFEARGVASENAERAAGRALCLTGLRPDASEWAAGQRYSGESLIPDSAALVCGYASKPLWQFRADMQGKGQRDCASKLLRGPLHNHLERAHRELAARNTRLASCLEAEEGSVRLATSAEDDQSL